ncbi:hypothetical protein PMAYCL1PPCAC_25308, partial [Pristionchus mayeri]
VHLLALSFVSPPLVGGATRSSRLSPLRDTKEQMVRLQQPEATVLQHVQPQQSQQMQRPQHLTLGQRATRVSEPLPHFPLLPELQQLLQTQQSQPKSVQPVPERAYEPIYEHEVGVARALFSNASEYPDELAFTRGATLRVIHDPEGPELSPGWWYCVDERTGARGIAPANRLELIMAHFDQGFFNVANPLFDDFFMFSRGAGPPSDAGGGATSDLFDRRRRLFPGFGFDDFPGLDAGGRARSGSLGGFPSPHESVRRASTADDGGFRGIVRNIPIRVEQRESAPVPTIPTRSQASSFAGMKPRDDFSSLYGDRPSTTTTTTTGPSPLSRDPLSMRRAASSGQLSPTPQDEEKPTMPSAIRGSQTTLNSGSRVGSFADFPSLRKGRTDDEIESPVERLARNLRNLAARNGEVVVPITVVPDSSPSSQRTPSPSSSGIVADMDNVTDENKRSSAASSLSSEGGNSSFERNSNSSSSADEKLQPAQLTQLPLPLQQQPHLQQLQQERQPPPPAPPMVYPKLATTTTTSAMPSVFDSISQRPVARKDDFLPSSIAEDMRRNDSNLWKTIPTRVNGGLERPQQQRNLSSITETEMAGRKRALVTRMSDYARMIDCALERLRGATAPQFWRDPHVLQKNLADLRDAVTTINEALDHFVDGTARIAIDNASAKADELRALLLPLRDSRALIGALRQALDLGGWTLATLARDKRQPRTGLDSIEQFLIVVKRVPQECTALLDWLEALAPDPPTVCFMAAAPATLSSATGAPLGAFAAPAAPRAVVTAPTTQAPPAASVVSPAPFPSPVPSSDSSTDSKRLSSSSTTSSTVTSGDSSNSAPSSILKQPSSNGKAANGARVTFADDIDNRRHSSSSLDGASSRLAALHAHFTSAPGPSASAVQNSPLLNGESRILEEDDLESVLSDRDSFYQDYAQLDDPAPRLTLRNGASGAANGTRTGGGAAARRLEIADEDRQLVRFYAPQLAQHTDALALAIDEFIDVVEHRLPPREFVQKGKLIILAAHKLIYIGDSVSQCVKDAKLSVQVRAGADHLCNLLKECVAATKSAAEEYPNITHVQRMVDTIVGVSRAATDLKLLVESHI